MKRNRKIIEIDESLCNGCGACVPSCAEGAIRIVNGKATLVAEKYCDGLGACLGECPTGALRVVEREADDFEEPAPAPSPAPSACSSGGGCPGARIQQFGHRLSSSPCAVSAPMQSELGHWPVQIRLVPPGAPFLQGAHLLVAADCVPVAFPAFHRDFLRGKAVMIGCPKFDDPEPYIEKFEAIFRQSAIQGVTVVVMEVPCCQGLPAIVQEGMRRAGGHFPLEKVVISLDGKLVRRQEMAFEMAGR